jgi:hypothetical protein
MRTLTKQDVDEAWQSWAATELATQDRDSPGDELTPIAAVRMLAHLRFSSTFCDYILQNEPERLVEVTQVDVLRAVRERQSDLEEWREDWKILPDSQAKEEARRRFAQSHRARTELICLRHLWLASQARIQSSDRRDLDDGRDF